MPVPRRKCGEAVVEGGADQRIGQIDSGTVAPPGKQVLRQRDRRIAPRLQAGQLCHRITDQFVHRHFGIGHAIDKRAVGPVLEQPADQIGQQVLVPAHRGIDPHRGARRALGRFQPGQFRVNVFAHPVQPLEFERGAAGQRLDRGDRIGVVRGKGGVDRVGCGQQPGGAGQVRHVGRHLAGEHRIVGMAADLAELDLAIPVGALDQPDHDPALVAAGQGDHPVDQRHSPLAVSLHGQAKALPAGGEQVWIGDQVLDDVERQFQPLGLFGIDGEMDIGPAGLQGEVLEHRHQHRARRRGVQEVVARKQRRQFDRDPR